MTRSRCAERSSNSGARWREFNFFIIKKIRSVENQDNHHLSVVKSERRRNTRTYGSRTRVRRPCGWMVGGVLEPAPEYMPLSYMRACVRTTRARTPHGPMVKCSSVVPSCAAPHSLIERWSTQLNASIEHRRHVVVAVFLPPTYNDNNCLENSHPP